MQRLKGSLISFLLLSFASGLNAQLNFKAGYCGSYADPTVNNQILQTFNAELPWLEKTLKDMHFLSGVVMGVRQRFDFVALDASWYGRFRRTRAQGTNPATMMAFDRRLNYNFNTFAIGIENFIGNFSFGGSIDLNKTAIRTQKTGRDDRFTVLHQWNTGSHFFISLNFKSTQLQMSLRPFVQIHWSKVDLAPLSEELELGTIPGDLNDDFTNFGIMLIFFNGPQKD